MFHLNSESPSSPPPFKPPLRAHRLHFFLLPPHLSPLSTSLLASSLKGLFFPYSLSSFVLFLTSTMATSPAGRMLGRQLQQMQSDKDIPGISCGLVDNNVFEWEVMLMISDDVKLYGGMSRPSFSSSERRSAYVLRQPHRVLDLSSWKCRTC